MGARPNRKLLDNLELLKAAGVKVPENALTFVQDQDYAERGAVEVYKCRCGHTYESPVKITHYEHGCGKTAKKRWPRP